MLTLGRRITKTGLIVETKVFPLWRDAEKYMKGKEIVDFCCKNISAHKDAYIVSAIIE